MTTKTFSVGDTVKMYLIDGVKRGTVTKDLSVEGNYTRVYEIYDGERYYYLTNEVLSKVK
jgi:hypothetical protein